MTTEAHKRNPPGSERWGAKVKLTKIDTDELMAIDEDGIGGPKLYVVETEMDLGETGKGISKCFYCEADELAKWRAARASSQAGEAQ